MFNYHILYLNCFRECKFTHSLLTVIFVLIPVAFFFKMKENSEYGT